MLAEAAGELGVRALLAFGATERNFCRDEAEAGDLCRHPGTVLHVHMAEATDDVDDTKARGYAGPLERLIAFDALPAGSILAHGVHLSLESGREADHHGLWQRMAALRR